MEKPKILIVDDNMTFLISTANILSRSGFQILFALNGREALSLLDQRTDIDAVVLDMKMPGMNGLETLKKIKARQPLIEVIILTGYPDVDDLIDSLKIGATSYVMKPFPIERLIEKLKRAVSSKRKIEAELEIALSCSQHYQSDQVQNLSA